MSWEETRHRYSEVPKCSLKIVWAYWIEVVTPLQPPQGDDSGADQDWYMAEGVKVEEIPKEQSASSASGAQPTVVLRERPDLDSPRPSRSARSTRSEAGSLPSERSASHDPPFDRPAKEKGTRPQSCPPPWNPAKEQPFDDEVHVPPVPGGDPRTWRFASASKFLNVSW